MGLLVGSVQLIFMPAGGAWLGGGVVKKNLNIFTGNLVAGFCSGIAASPAYSE